MASLASRAYSPNPAFLETKRDKGHNNVQWLRQHALADRPAILLFGGTDIVQFRLRLAQARLRADLTPSHWSHCAICIPGPTGLESESEILEISLNPSKGFGFPAPTNAVQRGRLSDYAEKKRWPNVAVIHLPEEIASEIIVAAVARFEQQRSVLDALQLMLAWLAHVWSVGEGRNPLQEEIGIPSAAFLEVVVGAVGFDLTPGLESRSSCPEAIWQSARWWYQYHNEGKGGALVGAYCTENYLFEELDKKPEVKDEE